MGGDEKPLSVLPLGLRKWISPPCVPSFSAVLAGLSKYLDELLPMPDMMMHVLDVGVSFMVIVIVFAAMFKVLPDAYVAWRDVWLGAVSTAALFTIGKWAIGVYLATSPIGTMYGAASSSMIILLWVYYSALIFFLGAEFTVVYAATYGSQVQSVEQPEVRLKPSGEYRRGPDRESMTLRAGLYSNWSS